WPPGMAPRSACDCSTVNSGGWVSVACAMPRLVRYANNSSGLTGMRGSGAVTWGYRFGAPMLQSRTPFGIRGARRLPYRGVFGCGCSSGVEHDLAKVGVEGSNPFARSNTTNGKISLFQQFQLRFFTRLVAIAALAFVCCL